MKARKFILRKELLLEENQDKDNFYDEGSLNEFVDNDMISGAEEGFMLGYMDA